MEYLFIAGVLIAIQVKGYFGKKTSGMLAHTGDAILFNFVRMVICVCVGILPVLFDRFDNLFLLEREMFVICLLGGIVNAIFLASWILAAKYNSYAVIDVALAIGSIIPVLLCALFFNEEISGLKMIGFALIIIAVVIMALPKKAGKEGEGEKRTNVKKASVLGVSLMVLTAICDGLVNFSQQVYKQNYTSGGIYFHEIVYPKSVFNFYLYFFSGIVLFIILLAFFAGEKRKSGKQTSVLLKEKGVFVWKTLVSNLIMAVCLYLVTYFQMIAANEYNVPSQILYPIIKGGSLVLANFMTVFFFGEKLTLRRAIGMAIALVGVVVMNVM